jgi:N-acetylglutamate synthase
MTLHSGHQGQRVVVRRLVPGETGPSGGPAMTDVLGVLETFDDDSIGVRREDGELVTIARGLLVTGKPVPPRASTRLRISPEQLERVCEQGWQATTRQPLGEWTLRAADGFTGRANSARIGGDPGIGADEAVDAITSFYAAHDLPVLAQVVVGSAWQDELERRGWVVARHGQDDPVVQVASVAQARRAQPSTVPDLTAVTPVAIDDTVTPEWMALYGRTTGIDPVVVKAVMESGDAVAFARIEDQSPGETARVVAIGRAVISGDWMGLQAVEVTPTHRRRGLATQVVDGLLSWGASRGALSAYLQTLPTNAPALKLYARYGFVTHHAYRYLSPPSASR